MILNKTELLKIMKVLQDFPSVSYVTLEQEGGNGIGTCLRMTFTEKINGHHGEFSIEITGVDDW